MKLTARRLAVAIGAAIAVLVPAGLAWACVGVVSLTLDTSTVQPGGTLTVTGREFAAKVPITVRLDSLTGPVVATVPGPNGTMNSVWTTTVTLPSDLSSGPHLLLASQDHHDMNTGQPARAVFYVSSSAPGPAASPPRELTLGAASGPSGSTLVVIALLAAGAAALVAGAGIYLGSRRGADSQTQAVSQ